MGNLETPELVADIRSEGSPLENDALKVRLTRWSLVVKKLESGWEEQPTPEARGGVERSYPEQWLHRRRRA